MLFADEQDMRKMGGLRRVVPYTYAMFVIGSIALMGFPFLTGFYSKDVILEIAYAKYTLSGHFAHWLGTLAAFFTAFYSMRLLYLTFLAETNAYKKVMEGAHDAPIAMALPLFILSLGSIFIGYLTKDAIIGVGTDFWGNAIFILPSNMNLLEAEFIPHWIKLTPVIFSLAGAGSSLLIYSMGQRQLFKFKVSLIGRRLYTFLNRKWFFDKVYNEWIAQGALAIGYHVTYKAIDRGIIEMFGPYGISHTVYNVSLKMARVQSGYLYHYATMMMIGIILFVMVVGLWDLVAPWWDGRLLIQFVAATLLLHYYSK